MKLYGLPEGKSQYHPIKPPFSYGFPIVFLWFPVGFLWFSKAHVQRPQLQPGLDLAGCPAGHFALGDALRSAEFCGSQDLLHLIL